MLINLEYTTQAGIDKSRIVNVRLVDTIEVDPRPDAASKSIVKLSDGTKLYCKSTPEQLMQQIKGSNV